MKFFWRLFYGPDRIARARTIGAIVGETTCNIGRFGYNYNQQGERIRERITRRPIDRRHPLEVKYGTPARN